MVSLGTDNTGHCREVAVRGRGRGLKCDIAPVSF